MSASGYTILLLFAFACLWQPTGAQNSLTDDEVFLRGQLAEYDEWLRLTRMNHVLRTDSMQIKPDRLIVFLGSPYNDTFSRTSPDSLGIAWRELKLAFEAKSNWKLEEKLFNQASFLMEIHRDSLEVRILGASTFLFYVQISYRDQLLINQKIAAARADGRIKLPVTELAHVYQSNQPAIRNANVVKVRESISKYLKAYYSTRGTKRLYKAILEVQNEYKNELIYEITYLDHEILHDIGYFEYIRIHVKVEQRDDDVEILYDLQAKYGSGIFKPPRKNDYKSIENKYPEYLRDYQLKLENLIRTNISSGM